MTVRLKLLESDDEEIKSHLAAIIDSSDDAIISKNLDGIIQSWNKSAERMFGFTAEEAIGKHISLIIPKNKTDEAFVIVGKIKSGEKVDHFETIRQSKTGETIHISLTVSPIRDANGNVVGASKIARDITEQKRMMRELADASRRKDEFLANISHELRTPMNAVLGLAGILHASPALPAREKTYIETLKGSAENLLALINNLLDFSRLDMGQVDFEKIEFNLPEVVERTINLLKVKADAKLLPVNLIYDTQVNRYYMGDPLRLQQILTNFIDNAIKFTATGRIEVHVGATDDHALNFTITDTGIGIAPDKIALMFEKFTQADASTTRKYGGSGLGLSIAKKLIEKMDGSLDVESKPDIGTRITFVLPFVPSQQVALVSATDIADAERDVLIVDDYEANLMVMSALLDQFGLTYHIARDGVEALQCYASCAYKVILMDVQMHGMDGYQGTEKIRQLEASTGRPRTPIIGVTAHVSQIDRDNCVKAGMDDFLPKPFPMSVLEEKIRKFLG